MTQSLKIKVPGVIAGAGQQKVRRDRLLYSDPNNATQFLFDTALEYSFPGFNSPVDGALIRDLAEVGDGELSFDAGQSVLFTGGGLDFSALTADPAVVKAPSGCLSAIDAGLQYFLVAGWFRFPTSTDWNGSSSVSPFFTTTPAQQGYLTSSDMLTISQVNTPALEARRQTDGGGAVDILSITDLTDFYDQVCQIAYWRDATGCNLQIRSALDTQRATAAVGAANSGDFSANQPRFGTVESFNNVEVFVDHAEATNYRMYRGYVANLEGAGLNAETFLDADWTFNAARDAFS